VPIFERWSWATRELLGMMGPPQAIAMGVTPLIYAAPIMRAAYQAIEAVHERPWKDVLLDPKIIASLHGRYEGSWAEHHIYYTVGARLGLLRACHAISGIDVAQRLHGHGVWEEKDWPNWDVARAFDTKQPGFFSVCNSYTGMPAQAVADKIEPFLAKPRPAPEAPSPVWLIDHDAEHAPLGHELRVRILSRRPLIILGPYDEGQPNLRNVLSKGVLEPLRRQPAIVLVSLPTSREAMNPCRLLAARIARRQREAPLHRFVVLANTEIEVEMMRQLGVVAVLVSHNALLDERPFFINGKGEPEFDAVYNAGFHPAKRHHLAAQIPSLALIYANWHNLPQYGTYAEDSRQALPQAVDLNMQSPDGTYVFFSREELAVQLQRAKVGLCLSEVEGSMRGSIEYLFAGLPVVSTFSIGGRDQFFDDDFCAVVPPSPELIAGAVRELAARNISRRHVRRRTLYKLAPHRERLMQVVMQALPTIGHAGKPDLVWPWLGSDELVLKIDDFHRQVKAG
jgi:glycosyltransferase involved in cell wall biosynthesis